MSGLRGLVKDRIMAVIKEVEPESGWKVLLVDHTSVRIMSAACRMFDVTEEGVTLVENIEISRQPMPDMEALYFITPTVESVKQLCSDFGREKQGPMYDAAHVYFTSHVSDELLYKIKTTEGLISRLKSLKELNLEFISLESRAFTLELPDAFHHIYSPSAPIGANRKQEMERRIADKLLTLCVTLGQRPAVRYKKTDEGGLL
mmetsp:Transcript_49727/g.119170  ORF Transcript_49727/g.119170 Transcript_49727/m.119170 type:complete len:203 (+) Transcript_49727:57-665(+)